MRNIHKAIASLTESKNIIAKERDKMRKVLEEFETIPTFRYSLEIWKDG